MSTPNLLKVQGQPEIADQDDERRMLGRIAEVAATVQTNGRPIKMAIVETCLGYAVRYEVEIGSA